MYQLVESNNYIIRIKENSHIPCDECNRHYKEYLEWVNNGNEPKPIEEESIEEYREKKKSELINIIKENIFEIDKTLDQIRTQWGNAKTAFIEAITKQEIDDLFNDAVEWLNIT